MAHKVAIIGLGVIGQRTLVNMTAHERFTVTAAWDLDPTVTAETASRYPELRIGRDAADIISGPETEVVYIGVPPLAHEVYARATVAAGKAVFCEKPLGIDVSASRELAHAVEASGLPQAVNFVYGSAPAGEAIRRALEAGDLGAVAGADLRLHFAEWPRGWQKNAAWLAGREQGGFVREVVSHFVYLSQRLFGPAELLGASLRYPDDGAESHLVARLDCGGVPITIAGSVGGTGPDRVEFTVWGSQRSFRITDWYKLASSSGEGWRDELVEIENPALDAYLAQLDNLAEMLDGKAHTMPDFRAALSVQEIIEAMVGG